MKKIILLMMIVLCSNLTIASPIILSVECEKQMSACELYQDAELGDIVTYHGSIVDKLVINEDKVKKATLKDDSGKTLVSVLLKDEYKGQLEKLTQNAIGKRLLIVIDGHVIGFPQIREKIDGGAFMISLGEKQSSFKEKLKWLQAMTELTQERENATKKEEVLKYVVVTGILFIVALIYAFLPVSPKKQGASFAQNSPHVESHVGQPIRPLDHARTEYDPNYSQVMEEDLSEIKK